MQVFVIEPQPHTVRLLKAQKQFSVSGTARTMGAETERLLWGREGQHDLILLSAALPQADALGFLQKYGQRGTPIVIVDADETSGELVSLLEAGAAGYVPHTATGAQMAEILRGVTEGKSPLAPTVGTALVERMHELLALQQQRVGADLLENCPDLNTLTMREREILTLIRRGASNQDIAGELMIELGTVKNHVHNILKKLNVTRRDQAASYADLMEQTP